MKFIQVIYFMIALNIVLFLSSSIGIWSTSDSVSVGLNPASIQSLVLGALGYGGLMLLVGVIGSSVLTSQYFSSEKVIGYSLLSGLYGGLSVMSSSIISSANVLIGVINISTIFNAIFFIIFLMFIVQTIFGGFKTYE